MPEDRIQKLNELDFDWDPTRAAITLTWDKRLGELERYKTEHGHCNVPDSQGPLGRWVTYQRKRRNEGKMPADQIQKLDGLGFDWGTTRAAITPTWDERLVELERYKTEHGTCSVPQRQGLGRWVSRQRQNRRGGKMPEDRIKKLDDLGFNWDTTRGAILLTTWDKRLKKLKAFEAEHGHCKVPEKQGSLGIWAKNQRQNRKKGKLPEDLIQKLDDLGFNWGKGFASLPENGEGSGSKRRNPRDFALDEHQATATAGAGATPGSKQSVDVVPTRRSARKRRAGAVADTQEGDTPISALTAAEEDGSEDEEEGPLVAKTTGGEDEDSSGSREDLKRPSMMGKAWRTVVADADETQLRLASVSLGDAGTAAAAASDEEEQLWPTWGGDSNSGSSGFVVDVNDGGNGAPESLSTWGR